MNYYQASERKNDSRWDYTRNQRPAGYCCEYQEIDSDLITEEQLEKYRSTAHKHHTDGHATEEEACDCYREYQLDHNLRFSKMSNQQQKCRICDEWSQGFAECGNQLFVLCDEHRNRESVESLYRSSKFSMSSW